MAGKANNQIMLTNSKNLTHRWVESTPFFGDNMAKAEPVLTTEPDATNLKRFFKQKFGIPVRVHTGTGKGQWIRINICHNREKTTRQSLVYDHTFPPELGQRCLTIIYGKDSSTSQQSWAGNVMSTNIAMHRHEWIQLLTDLLTPVVVPQVEVAGGSGDVIQSETSDVLQVS